MISARERGIRRGAREWGGRGGGEKKERKKTDNPREGWEDGTPPPHRDFKERGCDALAVAHPWASASSYLSSQSLDFEDRVLRALKFFLVPVRASPVPSVVRGSFVVKFFFAIARALSSWEIRPLEIRPLDHEEIRPC